MQEQIDHIKQMNCKKHIKIYKMHLLGLKNNEIADHLGTNAGNVYNYLKEYSQKPERVEEAAKWS